jgi:hypothetical protein
MATAARPTSPADARVPCPLCGGPVHPIAGRCKHCKQDLTQFRGARPHAAVPLPALVTPVAPVAATPSAPVPVPIPTPSAPAPSAPTAVPIATLAAQDASQPVLPPRPTGRSMPAQARGSTWKSWPVLVIALALVAIVAAVVLMVLPDRNADAGQSLPPPPAPERMDTSPLPPHAQAPAMPGPGRPSGPRRHAPTPPDPWNDQVTPAPRPIDPDDLDDQLGGGTPGGGVGGAPDPTAFATQMMSHACKRLTSCPGVDPTATTTCAMFDRFDTPSAPPTCSAGRRCLASIDQLSCSQVDSGNVMQTAMTIRDCMTALSTC